MRTKHVIVLPYDSVWKVEAAKLQMHLESELQGSILTIEHIGSTSIEGLAAKPIIDLDIVIKKEQFQEVKARLETIGYFHEGDLGIKDREAFRYAENPGFMEHHLYVCPDTSEELKRHLLFRNHLRTHTPDRDLYGRTKRKAAAMYPEDIDSYIAMKSPVIEAIYRKIGL